MRQIAVFRVVVAVSVFVEDGDTRPVPASLGDGDVLLFLPDPDSVTKLVRDDGEDTGMVVGVLATEWEQVHGD